MFCGGIGSTELTKASTGITSNAAILSSPYFFSYENLNMALCLSYVVGMLNYPSQLTQISTAVHIPAFTHHLFINLLLCQQSDTKVLE